MMYRTRNISKSSLYGYWIIEYKKWWWFPFNWHFLSIPSFGNQDDALKFISRIKTINLRGTEHGTIILNNAEV